MHTLKQEQCRFLADRLRALSDETRLRILVLLGDGERCQCEIKQALGAGQPLLSFHLKTLRNAGLIHARRKGRWVFYRACCKVLEEVSALLQPTPTANRLSDCCIEAAPTHTPCCE